MKYFKNMAMMMLAALLTFAACDDGGGADTLSCLDSSEDACMTFSQYNNKTCSDFSSNLTTVKSCSAATLGTCKNLVFEEEGLTFKMDYYTYIGSSMTSDDCTDVGGTWEDAPLQNNR